MTGPIGEGVVRVGGVARVTGQYQYVGDIRLRGMLHAKLVTLDCAHARLVSVDVSAAKELPGVRVVLCASDIGEPMPRFGAQYNDRPILAAGETLYHGEPVAAVAAESEEIAEEAARLVKVEYEPLPGVFTLAEALAEGAPLVQAPVIRGESRFASSNLLCEHVYGWGEIDEGICDLVVEGRYTFPMVTQFAIETHGCIAAPTDDGMTVWSAIQHPYWLQKVMSRVLGLPLAKVRVIAPDPGGAFGGKQHAKFEPLVALLAQRAGRPVRLVLSLEESFQAARRAAAEIAVRTGFRRDGTMLFREIEADYLLGAYADIADKIVSKGAYVACGPYRIPAARIVARGVLSNTPPATAFRGFGTPQQIWAGESNMEEAARLLAIDPLELRQRNLAGFGEEFIAGDLRADGRWHETVEKAARAIGWGRAMPQGHGLGLAVGLKAGITAGLSYATVRVLFDGSVVVQAGTSDMGQGARTVFAQIVAAELGAAVSDVTVVMGDTFGVPYDQQTSASRSTVDMGSAVLGACKDVRDKVLGMAADRLGVERSELVVEGGRVRAPGGWVTLTELAQVALGPLGGEVTGLGQTRREVDPGHPLGGQVSFYELNCTAVEVRVDSETGEVVPLRHVTVSDVGKAINPVQVRGQDEGGAIQALGHTLMENYVIDRAGLVQNLGATDYHVPTSMDLPERLDSDVVENADGPGPYGSKGMSEGALLPVAPAVAAAVRAAVGLEVRDLPLTAERVWMGLQDMRRQAASVGAAMKGEV